MSVTAERNEIEKILASKDPARSPFTGDEVELINRYQQAHSRELAKRDFSAYADRVLSPFMEMAAAAQKAGPDSQLAKDIEALAGGRPNVAAQEPTRISACTRTSQPGSLHAELLCRPPLVEGPPYTYGGPAPEQVGPAPSGAASVFATFSNLAVPETGKLSAGVANGTLGALGTYPSLGEWAVGDANFAGANIFQVADVAGGPYEVPSSVSVSVDIDVGHPGMAWPYLMIPGTSDSAGGGLVGVWGTIYLQLYGTKPMSPTPRTSSRTFLQALRTWSGSWGATPFPTSFTLSETLGLQPGSTWVVVNLAVELIAFRAGFEDPSGGFCGIDLRAPYEATHGIIPLQPAGGPIQLSNMTFTFCPMAFISGDFLPTG